MPELDDIAANIRSLHEKVDRALQMLESLKPRSAKPPRSTKAKPEPLTEAEMLQLQTEFAGLYERWINGEELEVQTALDSRDADQLRRLADANNLNVTAKMPKDKVLHLIGVRFREKKHLLKLTGPRGGPVNPSTQE